MRVSYEANRVTVSGTARDVREHLSKLSHEAGAHTPLRAVLADRLMDQRIRSFRVSEEVRTRPRA